MLNATFLFCDWTQTITCFLLNNISLFHADKSTTLVNILRKCYWNEGVYNVASINFKVVNIYGILYLLKVWIWLISQRNVYENKSHTGDFTTVKCQVEHAWYRDKDPVFCPSLIWIWQLYATICCRTNK